MIDANEQHKMILRMVRIHSHEGAATLHPRRYGAFSAAMVRMSTMPAFVPLVFQDAYSDVIELRFADVTKEGWESMQAYEKDLIQEQLAAGHAMWPMEQHQAKAIAEFVDRVKEKVQLLVVHCDAGVSRSSAVAKAVCEQYGVVKDLDFINNHKRYSPNKMVHMMVKEELEGIAKKGVYKHEK